MQEKPRPHKNDSFITDDVETNNKRNSVKPGVLFLILVCRRGETENKAILSVLSLFSLLGPHGNQLIKGLVHLGCKKGVKVEDFCLQGPKLPMHAD